MTVEDIAMVCHEANRAYQYTLGQEPSPTWFAAPSWQVDSAISGVAAALSGTVDGPEGQWAAWKADKERDGWRYGPVKNAETKEHPCMVATYDQLPIEERRKDILFRAIVEALTA